MAELIGDLCIPSELIVPVRSPASALTKAKVGTLVMSGAKLYVAVTEGVFQLVTSA